MMGDLLSWIVVVSVAVLAFSWALVSIGIFGLKSRLDLVSVRLGDLSASLKRLEARLGGEPPEENQEETGHQKVQDGSLREQAERIRKQKKLDYEETFPE